MKRVIFFLTAAMAWNTVRAGYESLDSALTASLDEVIISSTRVAKNAPMTASLIGEETLENTSTGTSELPFLMQFTPSVIAVSDNGVGIGTSYLRIRGTGGERINFTMDGVPLNNPEDQCVFWANMNSYSASVQSLQIQRGVGSSTNGSGAFGASVSMESDVPDTERHLGLEVSGGTFGTYSGTVKAGTGLIGSHLSLDGRLSYTQTDGYVDRTGAKLGSYFAQAAWQEDSWILRLKNFGGYEHTGQAWNGVPSAMIQAGNRTFNDLGYYHDDNGDEACRPTTDNYWQNITHLSLAGRLNSCWNASMTLSLNVESGYYEDMKDSTGLGRKFGLNQFGTVSADRHKWVDCRQYGVFTTAVRTSDLWELTGGAGTMWYTSDHWGDITWIQGQDLTAPLRYYESDADKLDANVFAKAMFHLGQLNIMADVQLRHVDYHIGGENDKFIKASDGLYHNQILDVSETFTFFNPKAGISWNSPLGEMYLSLAQTHREPTRNNYTDNGGTLKPKAETLNDIEAGWSKAGRSWHAGANLYYMGYRDQLIPTGRLSEIGEALTENVARSYRKGIEVQCGIMPTDRFTWELGATVSDNRILDFTEYIDNWDDEDHPVQVHYDRTHIALSPWLTASSMLTFDITHGLKLSLSTLYVGRQFLDNSSCRERSIAPYSTSDLTVGYTKGRMRLSAKAGNIFGAKYASGGWIYSAVSESSGYTVDNRYTEDGLFVNAPHTFIITLSVDL